jgi:hypothetical protein
VQAESATASDEHSTSNADRYTFLERIGAGGAAVVYRARDAVSGRVVALKQLLATKSGKRAKTLKALFEREYHTLVRLKHPRIIQVYDYGVLADGPYYTMELLEGRDLSQLKGLPYPEVCRHLRDVASSLALVHAQRFVHRDVSPRNIRLTADGTARLLDFGALAAFGPSAEVIGTPAFMAPEVVQLMPLDPRTDLYSLGAVAYYCLTGRPAYATQDVNDLPRLWQDPIAPPSAFAPDTPAELDRLIMSMLSLDPLGRPQTAADVIDQLTVIGQLPAEAHERAEASYLLSCAMVGRTSPLERGRRRIEEALAGKGSEIVIEGPAGIGKTRLANELCLSATLHGAVTLRASSEAIRAQFGVAVTLALRLLETCPEVARRTAEPHVATLRALSPELADALGGADSGTELVDAAERRARGHAALRSWFLAVSQERTLIVCVDDVHAADEDSAAFLVALGRDSRSGHILVLTTVRKGSPIGAPESIKVLRDRADRFKLGSLDVKVCEQLAAGLFGGAANAGPIGNLLLHRSGGVPRQFIELAQLMVQKKIARYEGGGWVLPQELAEHELPARSEEMFVERLADIGVDAMALAQTLAIHEGAVPLAIVLGVSELVDEASTHRALDELLAEQVLVRDGDAYRFRYAALRDAVLSRLEVGARARHCVRAADTLLAAETSGVAERIQAGLLLVDAGERDRGVRLLVTAAREFGAGAGSHHDPDPLVRALCRMVRAYDEQGRSDHELAALLFPLMPLAYYSSSWQFLLEYGERAIDIGIRITGLRRAGELVTELGPVEALKRGLGEGAAGFTARATEGLDYDLKMAIGATIGMVPACIAVYAACLDTEAVARIADNVAPLTLFGEQHIAYTMHQFAIADKLVHGRESESFPVWKQLLARLQNPEGASAVGRQRSRALEGGVLFTVGLLASYCFGPGSLDAAEQMDGLGVKAWKVTADQVRLLYHAFRGESNDVQRYSERVEHDVVQGAQTWQAEMFWPTVLLKADVLAGDAMSARRRYVQLERRSQEVATLKVQADAAHAAYLLLRGDVSEAISLYEKLLPSLPVRRSVGWEFVRGCFARALNAAGAHERAIAIANEVVSNMVPEDEQFVGLFVEPLRQLALAESGLGNHSRAAAILDELLAKHADGDNPLIVGLLHQARAEIAERAEDRAAAESHRKEMETRFRATRNPVLVAQCERAGRRRDNRKLSGAYEAVPLGVSAFTGGAVATLPSATRDPPPTADGVEAAEEPLETVLALVVKRTRSRSAHLYLRGDDDLRLAWSSTNALPPAERVAELARFLDAADERAETRGVTTESTHIFETAGGDEWRLVALRRQGGSIAGGLLLEPAPGFDAVGATDVFESLCRVIESHQPDALGFVTA